MERIYIGTYWSKESKGVYRFLFDGESGAMTEPELYCEARNAKWISLQGKSLSIPIEEEGEAGTCFLEQKEEEAEVRGKILTEKDTPCHILQEGDLVFTANYHEGTVLIYRMKAGKPELMKRIENGKGAGCHQIMLHGSWLLVPCLVQDRVRLFDREHGFEPAGEITFPEGTGPRHGVFNKAHTRLYLVSEWSSQLFIYQVRGMEFKLIQSLSVLPGEEDRDRQKSTPAPAAIRLTKDERFLYLSIRGLNLIAVLDVSGEEAVLLEHVSSGGDHPRDFILSRDEHFLIVANRFEGGIVSIERDTKLGLLGEIRGRIRMPEGVALVSEPGYE